MQMIRYHPLIDGDTDGLEKGTDVLSTDKETVRQNSEKCTCRRLFPIITGFIQKSR